MGENTLHLNTPIDKAEITDRPRSNEHIPAGEKIAVPKPAPGMVMRYSYLWHREAVDGKQEGTKDRPCVVIAVLPSEKEGSKPDVLVAPITHSEPMNSQSQNFIEIPTDEKRRLGMDDLPSYICCAEVNRFEWPGGDLRLIANKNAYSYGLMDKAVFGQVKERVLDIRGPMVKRDLDACAPESAA